MNLTSSPRPIAAFVLSLISGILVVLGGVIRGVWWTWGPMGWSGMMHEMEEHMPWQGYMWVTYPMSLLGIVFGAAIIVLAIALYTNPQHHELLGALIIVFSALSVTSYMGGMVIGLLLGVIGGILAIVWKP